MKHAIAAALLALALMPVGEPALAGQRAPAKCDDCVAPRKHYDSQEVIKTNQDVDRSRVINTTSVVYKRPRLVMPVPVVRVPVVKVVEVVVQRYHVVEVPNYTYRPLYRPAKDCSRGGRGYYGSCHRPIRARG